MAKCHAYRNTKICTKDCLCLFVCPTGASNNETGQIDFSKCIGCGACANACPSKAITMIPNEMPKQQEKNSEVINSLLKIVDSKIEEIQLLNKLLIESNESNSKFIKALIHSNKVIIEDLMRESGYMLPQSKYTFDLLTNLSKLNDENLKNLALSLLNKINFNE